MKVIDLQMKFVVELLRVLLLAKLLFAMIINGETSGQKRLIVGGKPASEGRYPWMLGLHWNPGFRPFCGGTLIASNVVLTAGHCPPANIISIGCLKAVDEECEKVFPRKHLIHPKFNRLIASHDFQLIQLKAKVKSVQPIPFVASKKYYKLIPGTHATVIGWGTTLYKGLSSNVLLEAEVVTFDQELCNNLYFVQGRRVEDNMICAAESGKDACQGDSGGPLFIRCDENHKDILIGIVSWGIECADANFPGVYSRISAVAPWIRDKVKSLGGGKLKTPPPVYSICN